MGRMKDNSMTRKRLPISERNASGFRTAMGDFLAHWPT